MLLIREGTAEGVPRSAVWIAQPGPRTESAICSRFNRKQLNKTGYAPLFMGLLRSFLSSFQPVKTCY